MGSPFTAFVGQGAYDCVYFVRRSVVVSCGLTLCLFIECVDNVHVSFVFNSRSNARLHKCGLGEQQRTPCRMLLL